MPTLLLPLWMKESIQASRSAESSRSWLDCFVFFVELGGLNGGSVPAPGCNNFSFVLAKSLVSREGTPAVTLQWCCTSVAMLVGSASVLGRMRRRSHVMLRARRCSVEILVGRMIQRITRETTRGLMGLDLRADRKVDIGLGVVLWSARRWRVHSGIVFTRSTRGELKIVVLRHDFCRGTRRETFTLNPSIMGDTGVGTSLDDVRPLLSAEVHQEGK